jgi:hypothetical protein
MPPVVPREPFLRRRTVILIPAALGAAVVCFGAVAFLPAPAGPLFQDPLRSFLTGFGVLGVAYPLCAVGWALNKRYSSSPYFEGAFIAGVLNLFGFVCGAVGLVCIGFGVYGLLVRFFGW